MRQSAAVTWICAWALAGCAAAQPSQGTAPQTVASRDGSGDLVVREGEGPEASYGAWLAGLAEHDVLVYTVEGDGIHPASVRYRVERLVRRRQGVAALLVPLQPAALEPTPTAHWLAGDEAGLYRLATDEALRDPGLVPLELDGRVINEARSAALWRVPKEWQSEVASGEDGWSVEELSMVLDGPVRGDRCAYIARAEPTAERLVVCGNVGLVERRIGSEERPVQSWTLVEITRRGS